MNCGIAAVKKEVLPDHAWKNASGRGNGKIARMRGAAVNISPLSENEMIGRLIMEKAGNMKAKQPTRAEKDGWAARLLAENIMRDNHSC